MCIRPCMTTTLSRSRKGYTLVEILVVIAIIAVMAAVAYPIIMRQMESGNVAKAKSAARDLDTAIDTYAKDNSNMLPLPDGVTADPDADGALNTMTDSNFVQILMGAQDGVNNPRGKRYFEAPTANSAGEYGIVFGTDANGDAAIEGLADPWGRGYFVMLDYDADGIVNPNSIDGSFEDREVQALSAVLSLGPEEVDDGAGNLSYPKPVVSWK